MLVVKFFDFFVKVPVKIFDMWKHYYEVSRTLFYVILVGLAAFFIVVWISYDLVNAIVGVLFILGILFLSYVNWGGIVYDFAFRKFYAEFSDYFGKRKKAALWLMGFLY